jgi:hypothetical protein
MIAQENLYKLVSRTPGAAEFFSKPFVWPFAWLFGRIMINISMAFAFFTFGLIKKEIWIRVSLFHIFIGLLISNLACSCTLLLGLYCVLCGVSVTRSSSYSCLATEAKGRDQEDRIESMVAIGLLRKCSIQI